MTLTEQSHPIEGEKAFVYAACRNLICRGKVFILFPPKTLFYCVTKRAYRHFDDTLVSNTLFVSRFNRFIVTSLSLFNMSSILRFHPFYCRYLIYGGAGFCEVLLYRHICSHGRKDTFCVGRAKSIVERRTTSQKNHHLSTIECRYTKSIVSKFG